MPGSPAIVSQEQQEVGDRRDIQAEDSQKSNGMKQSLPSPLLLGSSDLHVGEPEPLFGKRDAVTLPALSTCVYVEGRNSVTVGT